DWLEQFDEDVEQRIRLIDQVLTAAVPPDVRMVHLLRWLDPTLPPVYRDLSLRPEDVSQVPTSEGIVAELWGYQLLGLLAHVAGGAQRAEIDRRWRVSVAQLEAVQLPPHVMDALRRSRDTYRAALLRAAADPAVALALAQQATDAHSRI